MRDLYYGLYIDLGKTNEINFITARKSIPKLGPVRLYDPTYPGLNEALSDFEVLK